jgi:RNA polymerase sigma-70 factor (ECF subfamily)
VSDPSSPANLAAFAAGLGEVSLLPDEALVQALADASATGARAWPDLQVPAEPFFRQLGRCLRQVPGHRPHLIRQLALGDLYLATACLLGQRTALAHLETTHLKAVPQFIAHLDASKDFGDEVEQAVRHKLLLAQPGEDARLAQYQAQGPLLNWIAVIAQRTALDLLRARNRAPKLDDDSLERRLADTADLELALARDRLRGTFEQALRAAVSELTVRERTCLRLSMIEGLSLDRLGTMYRVNASTVSRWLARARQALLAELQRQLKARENIAPEDVESIVRLVRSQVDVSLSGLLSAEP